MTTPVRGEADMQSVVSRSAFQVLVEQSESSVSCQFRAQPGDMHPSIRGG